jgi:hypothetical protein
MKRVFAWYGADPLHLATLIASFALAGYAAVRMLSFNGVGVAIWFIGAVIGHDLVLLPLYSLADRPLSGLARRRRALPRAAPWVNYVRVPAALSALLLLVWFPLIFRLPADYHAVTALSDGPYLARWLLVTGCLFFLSAACLAVGIRRRRTGN